MTHSIEKCFFHWKKSIEKKYWEKINIDTINWEKLFDRSAEQKWCSIPWLVNLNSNYCCKVPRLRRRFCPYMRKYGSVKARILAYFKRLRVLNVYFTAVSRSMRMLVLVPYVNNQWHTIFYRTETIPSYKFVVPKCKH